VRRVFVIAAKVMVMLAIAASLFVLTSLGAFLITYLFIDGSEAANPGTDLGAGMAFGLMLLLIALPVSLYGGLILGMRFLFGMRFGEMLREARST
jgi:hypothetical protein